MELIDTTRAAAMLGLNAKTLSHWRIKGREGLPYLKIGRAVRYKKSDVIAFAEGLQTYNSTSEY